MIVTIEAIVIGIIFLMVIVWAIWNKVSLARIRKNYNPNENKSRRIEETGKRTDRVTPVPAPIDAGPGEPEEHPVLPSTVVADIGKDSPNPRKSRLTSFFRRRKTNK